MGLTVNDEWTLRRDCGGLNENVVCVTRDDNDPLL